ncbi:FAD-dependent oxidoreductase [Parapedobacter deserti]|uniref:FAD-dependent oxidoreductase n=1 Tax=Parapedobacter deserti TaxID=1912957 RepID=A0ABV7JT52_9SPHI
MNKIAYFIAMSVLWLAACERADRPYDIVIYGGTPGGFIAAIHAANNGKTVALIEPTYAVGGILVNGLGVTDIDSQKDFQNSLAVGGLAIEFYRRIAVHYDREAAFLDAVKNKKKVREIWPHEPGVAERLIEEWLAAAGVHVFTQTRLSENSGAVTKSGTRIQQIAMEDGKTFRARVFIDASYEGDLLAAAGVSVASGRESNDTYGETLNGVRAETTHAQFALPIDPYVDPGNPSSGLIYTIQPGDIGQPGSASPYIQAYCFRACLTPVKENQIPFEKPAGYDRSHYEIYLRYLRAGGKLLWPWASVPNQKSDLGAWHDLSHNLYGMNVGYPTGDYRTREAIFNQHKTFTQGWFYFLANDPEVGELDPDLQREWASWGLAKDEFTDNGGWPRQFYVRSARRMVSDYVITEHHILTPDPIPVEDPVGVAYWPPDVHSTRRIVKDGYAYNEGFVFEPAGQWRPLPISYRALVPKPGECTNLLTPTCPSSSYIAYGAIRLEWTFMVLGHSAAAAAILAIDEDIDVQQVDYGELRRRLEDAGQILDLPGLI